MSPAVSLWRLWKKAILRVPAMIATSVYIIMKIVDLNLYKNIAPSYIRKALYFYKAR
jgi:hypothetical protein